MPNTLRNRIEEILTSERKVRECDDGTVIHAVLRPKPTQVDALLAIFDEMEKVALGAIPSSFGFERGGALETKGEMDVWNAARASLIAALDKFRKGV